MLNNQRVNTSPNQDSDLKNLWNPWKPKQLCLTLKPVVLKNRRSCFKKCGDRACLRSPLRPPRRSHNGSWWSGRRASTNASRRTFGWSLKWNVCQGDTNIYQPTMGLLELCMVTFGYGSEFSAFHWPDICGSQGLLFDGSVATPQYPYILVWSPQTLASKEAAVQENKKTNMYPPTIKNTSTYRNGVRL